MRRLFAGLMSVSVAMVLMFLALPAMADWQPEDGHKMHFPQLPDPNGWDVEIVTESNKTADDWQCSASGPVNDIHFWTSWAHDNERPDQDVPGRIQWITATIYSNIPVSVGGPNFSQPGQELWNWTFNEDQFSVRHAGFGDQGFYSAAADDWNRPDHQRFQQVNITDIAAVTEPFEQKQGEIYWLSLSASWEGTQWPVGWKTSQDHFEDAAVWWHDGNKVWSPLYDPQLGQQGIVQQLDFAFVITPEPSSFVMLGMAAVGLAACAWRKRRR